MNSKNSPQVRKGLPPVAFFALGAMFVMAVLFWMSQSSAVSANSGDIALAESTYPNMQNSRIDTCVLCHTSSIPSLNPYGAAYEAGGRGAASSLTGIAGADSDGDGFTNIVEIMALTFPGNAADHPVTAPTATNTSVPPSPTPTKPSPTNTGVPPTVTNTSVPPTATNTGVPPTATSTKPGVTATPMPTGEITATPKVTRTPKPSRTPRVTRTPSVSPTPCIPGGDDDDGDGEDLEGSSSNAYQMTSLFTNPLLTSSFNISNWSNGGDDGRGHGCDDDDSDRSRRFRRGDE